MFDDVSFQVRTFTQPIMVAFFMLLGYLEAGWLGLFAGLVLYGIAITTILISLIPFGGAFIWYNSYQFLAGYLLSFIPIVNTVFLASWIMLFIAILITFSTSSLIVVGLGLFLKYGRKKKNDKTLSATGIDAIDSLIASFPTQIFKGVNFGDLGAIFNKILEEIMKVWEKINKQIIGSALVFLGIGIASHDFWWENTEWKPKTSRPTHGAYEGLQLTTLGMQVIVCDKPFSEQIKLCMLSYFGTALCYIGFFLMQFIPKGISRIINHVFWWSGIALIMFNWYQLMQPEIIRLQLAKQAKVKKK